MKLGSIGSKLSVPAAVLVITASGVLGGAGAALADGPKPIGGNTPLVTGTVRTTSISAPGGRTVAPLSTVRVTFVKAAATGKGLTQAQCDIKAGLINTILGWKQEAANDQNQYLAEAYDDVAEQEIDNAMEQGCAIIF